MSRAYFNDVAIDVVADGVAVVLSGVEVTVTKRNGDPVQIFESPEGGVVKDNPFITNVSGDMSFWGERGKYKITIVDTNPTPRISPKDFFWDSIPYQELLDRTPIGTMIESACRFAPVGWMLANGAAISRATYDELWDALRTDASGNLTSSSPHGDGNGSTTFNLPNKDDGDSTTNWIVRL